MNRGGGDVTEFFSTPSFNQQVVQHYYNVFNRTLAEFGLILRHLGTTYNDFLYEVKRALRGQFLCVAFIIPIGKQTIPNQPSLSITNA